MNKVSLNIDPGQLVVVIGDHGSGKSSLLKLLAKLSSPTSGSIIIDDQEVGNYDIHQLRSSMAIFTKDDEIYPVSLHENVLMGLPRPTEKQKADRDLVDQAVRLGGAYDLFQKQGYATTVNPPGIVGLSFQGYGNGHIGEKAKAALDKHTAQRKPIIIPDSEKQKLVACVIL